MEKLKLLFLKQKHTFLQFMHFKMYKNIKHTDGLFGNPTLWPQVFNKVTKRSRTVDCNK